MINARARINKQEREERTAMKRLIVMAVSVFLALILAAPMALGQVEQSSTSAGATGNLVAAWWQWAVEEPSGQTPPEGSYDQSVPPGDIQCDGSNPSGVWFLAGTLDGSKVERTCSAPANTQLFYPVVNNIWVFTDGNDTEAEGRAALDGFMNAVLSDRTFKRTLVVTVDGKPVKSSSIARADSPLFTLVVPRDSVFGPRVHPGEHQAVATGLWVTLPSLPEGEHTIQVEWRAPSINFEQNTTYQLTVG
jgi:hypothetical protein